MKESQILIDEFIECLPLGVILLNADFTLQAGNELAFKLLDISIEDALIDSFDSSIGNDELKDVLTQHKNNSAIKNEIFIRKNNRAIKCVIDSYDFQAGQGHGTIICIEDVSKSKQLENVKQDFVQTLLHKIRSPLATLKTSLSLVNTIKTLEMSSDLQDLMAMSYHEVNRLNTLLHDLRNLFLIETGLVAKEIDLESIPLADVLSVALKRFYKLIGEDEDITERFIVNGDLNVNVNADFDKLKQVLLILFKNAYEFSPKQKPIEINVSYDVTILTIEIKDFGIGVSEKSKQFLFSKYFREDNTITKNSDGNGLGLFIAKSFMELMNGQIYSESQKDRGSSFFITVPVC